MWQELVSYGALSSLSYGLGACKGNKLIGILAGPDEKPQTSTRFPQNLCKVGCRRSAQFAAACGNSSSRVVYRGERRSNFASHSRFLMPVAAGINERN
jgi:hypothetical protein